MARYVVDRAMALYIRDGDGLGNMTAVGSVYGTGQSGGANPGKVGVWNSKSTLDSRTNPTSTPDSASVENRTFTVGEAVTYGYPNAYWEKTGTFRGIYEAPNGSIYVVIHDADVYGEGTFVLIGPNLSPYDAIADDFDESKIKVENFGDFIVVCFLSGTLIATPDGERKVETLEAGDMVLAASGCPVPVNWLGRQTVSTLFGPAERLMPVRFAAGSIGGQGGSHFCRIAI